jgi:type IV secretion system protein VirB4
MFKVDRIRRDWKEAGSSQAHINLYNFWDEHTFVTKSGDLGAVLRIGLITRASTMPAGITR